MAIFEEARDATISADKVVRHVDEIVNAAFVLLDTLDRIADEGPEILKTIRNLVQSLITMVDNGVSALRNNPLAKGPWKIVMVLGAGVLTGVGLFLTALKRAITLLIELLQSRAARKLREVIDKLREKILAYVDLSVLVKDFMTHLIDLATFLAEQQDDLQKKYPGLRPLLQANQLKDIKATVQELERVVGNLDAQIKAVQDEVRRLEELRNNVNALVSAAATVTTVVNNILGFFANVFQRIKDLIARIPFIGWLEEKLGELIDWAMEELGIKAAIERMGAAARNLPFITSVFDFMESVKARVQEIIAAAEALIQHVLDEIKNNETVKAVVTEVVGIFAGLDIKKIAKFLLPDWALELAEKGAGLIEKLKAGAVTDGPVPEMPTVVESVKRWAAEIGQLLTLHYLVPELPVRGDLQPELDAACGGLSEVLAAMPPIEGGDGLATLAAWVESTADQLESVASVYQKALAMTPELRENYYAKGHALLVGLPGGAIEAPVALRLIAKRAEHLGWPMTLPRAHPLGLRPTENTFTHG